MHAHGALTKEGHHGSGSHPSLWQTRVLLSSLERLLEYLDLRHNAADTSEEVCDAIVKVRHQRHRAQCEMARKCSQTLPKTSSTL